MINIIWMTAREIAGAPGFEMTERAALDKLNRIKVPMRPRKSRGGGMEYAVDASIFSSRMVKSRLGRIPTMKPHFKLRLDGAIVLVEMRPA